MNSFLVAVPVYNERRYVRSVITKIRRYLSNVLIVDDGSTDGTAEVLRDWPAFHVITHPENRGYGQSLISAFDYAVAHQYDWLISMDCDEQHEPEFIPDFIAAALADRADIVSGSRYVRSFDNNSSPPDDRRRINATMTELLNRSLGLSLTDAFCGFKAYRVSALAQLNLDVPGYAMPMQFWVQAAQCGLSVCEIPVRLIYNDPNRHFGGLLDDPGVRLQHYKTVMLREMQRARQLPQHSHQQPIPCSG